jgi:AI-2 transport protein TqsA
MNDPIKSANITTDRGLRAPIALCTSIIAVTALYFSGPIFAPLAFALLIIAILWPIQKRLQTRLPKLVALAMSMLATIMVLAALGSSFAWAFGRVGRYVIGDAARFQLVYEHMAAWLEEHGIVVAALWAEHFNVGWLIRLLQQAAVRLNSMLGFSVVVLIYVVLGLLEVDDATGKLGAVGTGDFGRILLTGGAKTAAKLRKYMLVRTLMSVITGVMVAAFVALVGLPLAVEWGTIAFALNYIPFIGPFVATVFPTLFAIAKFDSWYMTFILFACLNLIQFLVGSYLEPRFAGRALSISPFLVLFAVIFWTFMWGIFGAFIGVPIVIAVLTLCEQHPSSRWIADLLGGPSAKQT